MKRYLICYSYKGTNFKGSQTQPQKRTVQQVLEDALSDCLKQKIYIYASGRTDSGVHALKQYAHFDADITFEAKNIAAIVNQKLPNDLLIISTAEIHKSFNARYDAKKKTYKYVFCKQPVLPVYNNLASPLKYKINMKLIKKAAKMLVGTHNFKAFCSSGTQVTNFERTIYSVKINYNNPFLTITITGNGFLYNMVRIIAGTLIDIGRGHLPNKIIKTMLKTGDRAQGGSTAAACGLYLVDVEY